MSTDPMPTSAVEAAMKTRRWTPAAGLWQFFRRYSDRAGQIHRKMSAEHLCPRIGTIGPRRFRKSRESRSPDVAPVSVGMDLA